MISIIPYETKYHSDFKQLNLEWLDQYELTESHDLMILDDPEGTIINNGGFIWLAKDDDKVVGSAGLMKEEGHNVYELVKMAVTPGYQGKGISRLLMDTCIAKAKEAGASKIFLFSNHQLHTAIRLYEKYGFVHVEVKDSPMLTADVKMELGL